MKLKSTLFYLFTFTVAMGFYIPLSLSERLALSDLVGVVSVESVSSEADLVALKVEEVIKGPALKSLSLFVGHPVVGRDPNLKPGRYLVFIVKDQEQRWCTVQSELDAFRIEKGMVLDWEKDANRKPKSVPLDKAVTQLKTMLKEK